MVNRPMIGSASHRTTNDKALQLITARLTPSSKVLDLGAGQGHLARRVAAWFEDQGKSASDHILATDLTANGFEASEVPFTKIDLDEPLPFSRETFDLIYSIEVFEHLHRPYDVLEECYRVLKSGGYLIVSTPNILHLQSRLRFFFTGFYELYQPPSIDPMNAGRLCGHIMPLHIAYYDYGLRLVGFTEVQYVHDRIKKGSMALYVALYPIFVFMKWRFLRDIRKYDMAVFNEGRQVLALANSKQLLTSRSLMLVAQKPDNRFR
jgi:ubiquinone/menaquinone biosynthesis C-methylase UbiE